MGVHFDALAGEAKLAVEWKARQNLSMALADGNQMALANQQKFLVNNSESIAANSEGVRQVILEFKNYISTNHDD
jgi:ribose 1,5-bisphosphokinase PhnN